VRERESVGMRRAAPVRDDFVDVMVSVSGTRRLGLAPALCEKARETVLICNDMVGVIFAGDRETANVTLLVSVGVNRALVREGK
jgi:hypothetical protein